MGRASDPSEKRRENKKQSRIARNNSRGTGQTPLCWADADAMLLANAVCVATLVGGSLQFGTTRDAGALTLTVYYDGERTTDYVRPSDDPDALLSEWCETFTRIWQEDQAAGRTYPPEHVDAVLRRFGA